jgi:hypothetical protein
MLVDFLESSVAVVDVGCHGNGGEVISRLAGASTGHHNDSLLFSSFASALHCCKSIGPSKSENHLEAEKADCSISPLGSRLSPHFLAFKWAQLSTRRVICA